MEPGPGESNGSLHRSQRLAGYETVSRGLNERSSLGVKRPLSERTLNERPKSARSKAQTGALANSVYAIQKEALIRELNVSNEARRLLQEQLINLKAECRTKTEALRRANPQLEAEYKALLHNFEGAESQLDAMRADLASRSEEVDILSEDLADKTRRLEEAESEIDNLRALLEQQGEQLSEMGLRFEKLDHELQEKEAQLHHLMQERDSLSEETQITTERLKEIDVKLDGLIGERDGLLSELSELQAVKETLKTRVHDATRERDTLKTDLSSIVREHECHIKEVHEEYESQLDSLRASMKELEVKSGHDIAEAAKRYGAVKASLDEAQERTRFLESELKREATRVHSLEHAEAEQKSWIGQQLRDQEAEISELRVQYRSAHEENIGLKAREERSIRELEKLKARLNELEELNTRQQKEVKHLRAENKLYDSQRTELAFGFEKEKTRCEDLTTHKSQLEGFCSKLRQELDAQAEMNERSANELRKLVENKDNEFEESQLQISILKDELHDLRARAREADAGKLEARNASDCAKLHSLQSDILKVRNLLTLERKTTRRLQNQVQELKGNIRVVARVRPVKSGVSNVATIKVQLDEISLVEVNKTAQGSERTRTINAQFDRVFNAEASNRAVCEETEYLVQSALEGRKVCILAYGQTGSGKTYTMSSEDGVNSFALQMIMNAVAQGKDKYQVFVESIEIYNERIYDLLADDANSQTAPQQKITIQFDSKTNTTALVGAQRIAVGSVKTAQLILDKAMRHRSVAETQANQRSSRSHFIFSVHIVTATTNGILHLVDLAGSERLNQSHAEGDRLKETQAINTSLSSLGNVIHALLNRRPALHVPYRSSKLTYLLQNSLSAGAKTMLLTTLSPEAESLEETKSTLRFAEKASRATLK